MFVTLFGMVFGIVALLWGYVWVMYVARRVSFVACGTAGVGERRQGGKVGPLRIESRAGVALVS